MQNNINSARKGVAVLFRYLSLFISLVGTYFRPVKETQCWTEYVEECPVKYKPSYVGVQPNRTCVQVSGGDFEKHVKTEIKLC